VKRSKVLAKVFGEGRFVMYGEGALRMNRKDIRREKMREGGLEHAGERINASGS